MPAKTKLAKACTTALKDYLGLDSMESLLVITDENMREIGIAMYDAGKDMCDEALYMEMKPRTYNGEEPPPAVADIMKSVDVVVAPTTKSLTHTNARRYASKVGVRIATMPGITKDTLVRCMSADYEKVVGLTDLIARHMQNISTVRIVTKAGTDVTLPVKNRRIIASNGVLKNIGESGNLPSGEVYVAPIENQSEGQIVVDGSMAHLGLLDKPITLHVRDGYAERITGGEKAVELENLLDEVGEEARAIGEFGIGTNYKAKISGKILEDEKVLGTVHIALGNNLSMGGRIKVPLHIDCVIQKPTVYFDDKVIMENGKLCIDDQE